MKQLAHSAEPELRGLRFEGELEEAFQAEWAVRSERAARRVLYLITAITILLGIPVLLAPPEARAASWLVRYGINVPTLSALLAFSYSRHFRRYMQSATAAAVVSMGWSWVALGALQPALQATLPLLLVVLTFATYTVAILRFYYAAAAAWAVIAAYLLLLGLSGTFRDEFGYPATIAILLANLLGMVSAYTHERYLRRDFLLHLRLRREQEKSERLLLNILPQPVAARLKESDGTVADSYAEVTVLFADIVDFTGLSAGMSAHELVSFLNRVFSEFDRLAERHGLEKIKTIGDAYMVVGGLPTPMPDHAAAIAEMALDVREAARRLGEEAGRPLALRIGINTGPVVAGVIGTRKYIYDLWGDTVNVASRMESHGLPGEIQVTPAAAAPLRERFELVERGPVPIKGRGEMTTYLLRGRKSVAAHSSV